LGFSAASSEREAAAVVEPVLSARVPFSPRRQAEASEDGAQPVAARHAFPGRRWNGGPAFHGGARGGRARPVEAQPRPFHRLWWWSSRATFNGWSGWWTPLNRGGSTRLLRPAVEWLARFKRTEPLVAVAQPVEAQRALSIVCGGEVAGRRSTGGGSVRSQ